MKESKKESALRILIVEDNEHDRIAFRRAFKKSKIPCVITEYEKAEDALLKIGIDAGSSFDIIVADHGLPGKSGLNLLKEIIKKGLQVPLVLLTGSGTEEIAIEALKAGIDDYIIKDDLKGYLGLLPLTIAAVLKNYNEKRLRIQAEKDTKEWKNRYETAARTSGHILYDWDSNTNEVTYGGDLEGILGYTVEEMKGGLSLWKELIHPDDRESFNEAIDHIKKTKGPANFQYRVLKKDRNYIYIENRGHFLTDTEGNVVRMIGFIEDITARKRAEEDLQERTRLIQLLQEITVAANEALTVGEAMKICLEKVCKYAGWPVGHVYVCDSKGTLLPTTIWHTTNPVKFKKFMEITEVTTFTSGVGLPGRVMEDGRPHWITNVTVDKNFHRAKLVHNIGVKGAFAFPVLEGKEVVAVLEFFSEKTAEPDSLILEAITNLGTQLGRVTERKKAQEALKESEHHFRSIFNNSAIGISLLNKDWEFVECNPEVCKMLGYTNEELRGKTPAFVSDPEYVDNNVKLFEELKEGKRDSFEMEKWYIRKDGTTFLGKLNVSLFKGKIDTPHYVIGMMEDITERKQAKEEILKAKEAAEKANRLKTQFIATTNHELRGPLHTIIGYLKLVLEKKYDNREEETDFLKNAYNSSIHLKGLISDLLDISAIESDKIRMTFKSVPLPAVFTQVRSVTSMLAKEKGIDLNLNMGCQCFETGQEVYCDPARLQQALVNLVGNAIKFTEKGSVTIYCESVPGSGPENDPKDSMVKIYVQDTGIGIAPDGPDIFEPFVQIGGPVLGGTGLGLSIAKKLVEKMGGTLELTSKGLGHGTTAIITMPVSTDQKNQRL